MKGPKTGRGFRVPYWSVLPLVLCLLAPNPVMSQESPAVTTPYIRQAMIGITAESYIVNPAPNEARIIGAVVTSDTTRRVLHLRGADGVCRHYSFVPNMHVILESNAIAVKNADDVRQTLVFGWNQLRILDRRNNSIHTYQVEIE